MKITTKVAVSAVLLVAILYAAQRSGAELMRELLFYHQKLAEVRVPAVKSTLSLVRTLEETELSLKKFFVTRDEQYASNLDRLSEVTTQQLATLESLATHERERQALVTLSNLWARYAEELRTTRANLAAPKAVVSQARQRELLDLLAQLRDQTVRLFVAWEDGIDAEVVQARLAAEQGEQRGWWLLALALGSATFFVVVIVRSVRRPLVRLVKATREVSEGRFVRLHAKGKDEFAELGRAFDAMLARLDEVDRMKRDFLSRVSHEIKTPLAAMQEAQQFISDGLAGPLTDKQRRMLDLNGDASRRLSQLLSRLLDSARLDAGAVVYDVRLIDLNRVAEQAYGDVEARLADRGLRGELQLCRQSCEVYGDADWLGQVVSNLLDNAIKISPRGSEICLRVEAGQDQTRWRGLAAMEGVSSWAVLSVEDRGPGVPDEDKARVFERFVQLTSGRASAAGVGLGLAICRDIVSAHAGTVWVEDAEPHGARFVVALPHEQGGAAEVSPEQPEQGVARVEDYRQPDSAHPERLRVKRSRAG